MIEEGCQFKPYSGFFPNLIRGRQQEFIVYTELYRASERLFGQLNLNIYDQVTDVDGVDFLIRCEGYRADSLSRGSS